MGRLLAAYRGADVTANEDQQLAGLWRDEIEELRVLEQARRRHGAGGGVASSTISKSKASPHRDAHALHVFQKLLPCAVLVAVLALGLQGRPCAAEAAPAPHTEAMRERVQLDGTRQLSIDRRIVDLAKQPSADGLGRIVEFLAGVAPESQSVPKQRAQEERQDGDAVVQQLLRFLHDHPFIFAGLLFLIGMHIGCGGEASAWAELYRIPRDWVTAARRANRQAGHATLQALGLAALFAVVLACVGPTIDARTYADYGYTPPVDAGEARRLELDARNLCAAHRGENSGIVTTADGAIVCTDKHGRRGRNVITVAEKVTR